MTSLRERFEKFIRTMDDFESVDDLLKDSDPDRKNRADYLVWKRRIILEQKVLEVDPHDKPQKFVDRLLDEGRVVAYGSVSTEVIFAGLPDGDVLYRKMIDKITERVSKIFARADKQTRDTKEIFSIPDAGGIIVLLNEGAIMLDPDLIGYALNQMFNRKNDDGSVRYPHNTVVVLITELHQVATGHATKLLPVMTIRGPNWTNNLSVESFASELTKRWAAFNNMPLIEGKAVPGQKYKPV